MRRILELTTFNLHTTDKIKTTFGAGQENQERGGGKSLAEMALQFIRNTGGVRIS